MPELYGHHADLFVKNSIKAERQLEICSTAISALGYIAVCASLYLLIEHAAWFEAFIGPSWTPALIPLLGTAPGYLGLYVSRSLKEKRNRLRAERLRALARADSRPPFIILRSFEEGPLTSVAAQRYGRHGVTVYGASFTHSIASALIPYGQLIAIGGLADVRNYYETSDVVFLQSLEERWFEMFSDALSAVRAVVLIPGLSEGLIREVNAIRRLRAWNKVLVFMPPVPDPRRAYGFLDRYADENATSSEWGKVRAKGKELGYSLPEYRPAGMVYAAGIGLCARRIVSLEYDIANLVDALDRLLAGQEGQGVALSHLLPVLEQNEGTPRRPGLFSRIYGVG